jgi:hypothetical protein
MLKEEKTEQQEEFFTDRMHKDIYPFPEAAFSSRALKSNTSHSIAPVRISIGKANGVRTQIRRNN